VCNCNQREEGRQDTGGGMCDCKEGRPLHGVADGSLYSRVSCERKEIPPG